MKPQKTKLIIIAILSVCRLFSAIPHPDNGLEFIKIIADEQSDCETMITKFDKKTEIIDIDLMCFSDNFKILISDKTKTNYKIEYRYETSITVQNEGPHIDLVNWKHYRSPWQIAESKSEREFFCHFPEKLQSKQFPKVTMSEVRNAVSKIDPTWLEYIKNAKMITEYPLDVGISRIYFRVMAKRHNVWHLVKTVCYDISLGC